MEEKIEVKSNIPVRWRTIHVVTPLTEKEIKKFVREKLKDAMHKLPAEARTEELKTKVAEQAREAVNEITHEIGEISTASYIVSADEETTKFHVGLAFCSPEDKDWFTKGEGAGRALLRLFTCGKVLTRRMASDWNGFQVDIEVKKGERLFDKIKTEALKIAQKKKIHWMGEEVIEQRLVKKLAKNGDVIRERMADFLVFKLIVTEDHLK
jgi:hypothetical protein